MSRIKKVAIGSLAAVMSVSVAMPAMAERGQGWGKTGWDRGDHRDRARMAHLVMERFDVDGDGKVTQSEIDAATARMFANADADTSGGISLEEFKAGFSTEFPDLKVRAFQRVDSDGDGSITKAEYDRVSARMAERLEAGARDGDRRGWRFWRGRKGAERMTQYDMNGDGNVTAEELAAARAALFSNADANADAALTLDEFESVWVRMSEGRMVRMFQRLDRDGDLNITQAEIERPAGKMVARMDRNGDGVLSIDDRRGHGGKWGHRTRDRGDAAADDGTGEN